MAFRLRSGIFKCLSIKQNQTQTLRLLSSSRLTCALIMNPQHHQQLNKTNLCLIKANNQIKRFYSEQSKLTQEQAEEKVLNIFKNFDRIKENPANPKVSLESHVIKDLGLDSLDHVEIIVQLEDTFGFEIPDSDYEKLYTPKEIVNYLLKKVNEV